MKLKALRLHGFKSFADRTEIEFHEGITAVVGPNGCGKSNISDAIRWVLGEQRPTAIRGARMEEAIFQGTTNRRPVHRGSVAIEISNRASLLPVPFEEVEIARTVYRDGGSEYQLNRSACRLRDIHDLCRDTGLGANAYAVIENRMIDAILSDRAEERRGLFEEAAGIGKYKDRRKAAARRLETAEADLQRLDDLIGEVESKVRSLARQKGRAERHREFRKRRLDLEVELVRRKTAAMEARLEEVRDRLKGGTERGQDLQSEIAAAEARVETLRAEQTEAQRQRTEAAAKVETLRSRLVEWERELAVAEERRGHAERRLGGIGSEREEARAEGRRARDEDVVLVDRAADTAGRLDAARAELEKGRSEAEEVQDRLGRARAEMRDVESQEREVARRVAQLEGDREAASGQARDLGLRAERLEEELAEARTALEELRAQGDLFETRVRDTEEEMAERRAAVEAAEEAASAASAALEEALRKERAAEDRAGALETRLGALERMERDREGMDPVVRALLEDPPEGVVGVLADFLEAEPDVAAAVEAFLGVVARGVVVRDAAAALRLARWFREEWGKGGGMVVLPLDRVPGWPPEGSLLARMEPKGEGAPWVRALLAGVDLVDDGEEAFLSRDASAPVARVQTSGLTRTRDGVVRVGNPLGATGLLERKEELRALRREAAGARDAAVKLAGRREAAEDRLAEARVAVARAREALRGADDAFREARSRASERSDRRSRMERSIEDLERQLEAARTGKARAEDRAEAATAELAGLVEEAEGLEAARETARSKLEVVQAEWEDAQARRSELTVAVARLEGEAERLSERRQELERAAAAAAARVDALDREEARLEEELEGTAELKTRGEEETRRLFELRDEAGAELQQRERVLETIHKSLDEVERTARQARSAEREASEDRHRSELESKEIEGRIERLRERLETEWNRSLEQLAEDADPVDGDLEALETRLREVIGRLDRLGPVNMLAVEEHEEESTRLAFLREQRSDLVEARDHLRSAIREINRTAVRLFDETFEAIRSNFRDTFQRLFQGGECDAWLSDPEDPLESVIEIHASPRGKRTQRIDLLSGGERALTALSLLFGIYLVKPSPFCVLDEVDAPLDESNIGRFIKLLQEFKHQTQFIVITHNPRTIEAADWIYGVTMEEPGVSSIVGVRLDEALETAEA